MCFEFSFSFAIHELAGGTDKRIGFFESKKVCKEELHGLDNEKDRKQRQIKMWADKVFRRWDLNQDGHVIQT